jgi:hypothetical protein
MFEMLTGEAPFDGEEEEELFTCIQEQVIRFPRWCPVPVSLQNGWCCSREESEWDSRMLPALNQHARSPACLSKLSFISSFLVLLTSQYVAGKSETNNILKGFLTRDPTKRLGYGGAKGAKQIKASKFFKGYDWAKVEKRGLKPPIVPSGKTPDANFDEEFTSQDPKLTPVPKELTKAVTQNVFDGFDWSR